MLSIYRQATGGIYATAVKIFRSLSELSVELTGSGCYLSIGHQPGEFTQLRQPGEFTQLR